MVGRLASPQFSSLRLRTRFSTNSTVYKLESRRSSLIIVVRQCLLFDLLRFDLNSKRSSEISSRFSLISSRYADIRPNSVSFGKIWHNFSQPENQPRTDRYLIKIWPPEPTPFISRWQVQVYETQSDQVGFRLGTNPTQTDSCIALN